MSLAPKFRGALVGAAVGDALGARFEGAGIVAPSQLDRLVAEPGPLRYTDDTHMTLGMAESLVERRGFDGAHMAALFAGNFAAEPWRGYGPGPPRVFQLLAGGVPWDRAARSLHGGAGSFGNGAAMRVAPAAMLAFRDLKQVASLARQTALITHAHELGQQGAALQGCAVALALSHDLGAPFDTGAFLDTLGSHVVDDVYRRRLDQVRLLLDSGSEHGRREVVARLGNGIEAVQSVPTALYAFLRSPLSFQAVVIYAISLGGDTDTIACMAGAIAGAFLGIEAIPHSWHGVEGASRLEELADGLLALAGA